jgi:ATP-dependent Clp protease protease subunit
MSADREFAVELRVAGRKGTIHLHDYIGADLLTGGGIRSKDLIAQLAAHGDLAELEVHINSAGGSAWDGIAMHNALKAHKARVTVEVDSLAGSAASVVAMSGDTIRMADGAMLMLHNPRSGAVGEASDLRKRAEVLDRIRESVIGIYAAKSGRKPEEIGRLMDEETWMNADEAREFGFVDEVVERPAVAACLDLSGFAKVPEEALKLVTTETPVMAQKNEDRSKDGEKTPGEVPPTDPTPQTQEEAKQPAPVQPGSKAAEATNAAVPTVEDVQALIAAERKRVHEINAKCQAAGVPQSEINRFVEANADLNAVNAFLVGHLMAKNPPIASDSAEASEPDPDAKLKAEYEADAAFIRKTGVEPVSMEAYIKSRKRAG